MTKAKERGLIIRLELVNSNRPVDYVLLEYAEENNIDLVVIGTRARNRFGRLHLGSVVSRILTYSHCLVLLVGVGASHTDFYNSGFNHCRTAL